MQRSATTRSTSTIGTLKVSGGTRRVRLLRQRAPAACEPRVQRRVECCTCTTTNSARRGQSGHREAAGGRKAPHGARGRGQAVAVHSVRAAGARRGGRRSGRRGVRAETGGEQVGQKRERHLRRLAAACARLDAARADLLILLAAQEAAVRVAAQQLMDVLLRAHTNAHSTVSTSTHSITTHEKQKPLHCRTQKQAASIALVSDRTQFLAHSSTRVPQMPEDT